MTAIIAPGAGDGRPPPARVLAAFLCVYVIWGSTYIAIRYAVETLPPFLMAGARFLSAGAVLYAWARLRGAPRPSAAHWRAAGVIGAFLLLGGNGAVVWAAARIPSSISSLLVAITPLWMVAIDWIRPGGQRPSGRVIAGLALGIIGMVLLIGPGNVTGAGRLDLAGAAVLLLGTVSWSIGSICARGAALPRSTVLATGMEMVAGGVLLAAASVLGGEAAAFDPARASMRSALSVLYLTVFGSLIAFTAYIWLLKVSTTARVSTYAFVNPVVAVLLGWSLGGEPLTARALLAAGIIVSAVAVITTDAMRRRARAAEPAVPAGNLLSPEYVKVQPGQLPDR